VNTGGFLLGDFLLVPATSTSTARNNQSVLIVRMVIFRASGNQRERCSLTARPPHPCIVFSFHMSGIDTLHFHDHLPKPWSSLFHHDRDYRLVSGILPYFYPLDSLDVQFIRIYYYCTHLSAPHAFPFSLFYLHIPFMREDSPRRAAELNIKVRERKRRNRTGLSG
jgi:hypothetical protein